MHSEAFIRQLTRPVTIMLKPAKTSDIIAKSCSVVSRHHTTGIKFGYLINFDILVFGN